MMEGKGRWFLPHLATPSPSLPCPTVIYKTRVGWTRLCRPGLWPDTPGMWLPSGHRLPSRAGSGMDRKLSVSANGPEAPSSVLPCVRRQRLPGPGRSRPQETSRRMVVLPGPAALPPWLSSSPGRAL